MKKDIQGTNNNAPENADALAGFNFNIGKTGKPTMTWTQRGFTFNKDAIELLGAPHHIAIGLDESGKRLAIREAETDGTEPKYVFSGTLRRERFAFVTATNIREALVRLLGYEPEKGGISYTMQFDKTSKFGIIDLTKGTKKNKSTEGDD